MMRSLSRRIRFATSSKRASAPLDAERDEPERRDEDERLLVDRLRLVLRPLRVLEPLRLLEPLRPLALLRLPEPLRLLEPLLRFPEELLRLLELRVLRRPLPELARLPEPDPPDPPLLACGMLPPLNGLKSGGTLYGQPARGRRRACNASAGAGREGGVTSSS